MTAEDSRGMKDADSSNVSHVSRKPLQCIDVTTPVISHVLNHYNAYDLLNSQNIGRRALFNYRARYDVTEFSNCCTDLKNKAKLSSFVQFENEMAL